MAFPMRHIGIRQYSVAFIAYDIDMISCRMGA